MDSVLQYMDNNKNKDLPDDVQVLDDQIPDCDEWEESLYQKKVEIKETAWDSYSANHTITVEMVLDDYRKGVRKVASDWTMNMPRDLYLQRYGSNSDKARLQGHLFTAYHNDHPFPLITKLDGRFVDSAFSVPCTVSSSSLTHVGAFSFPYRECFVHQFQGMTQVTAYDNCKWQGTLILNTMDVPIGWHEMSCEGPTITIGNRLITMASRGFRDTVYWEVDIQDISHPYIKGAFLEPSTIVPDLMAITDVEGSTYLDNGVSKVYMPVAATAIIYRGTVVSSKQYFDRTGENNVVASKRFLGLNDDNGQALWSSDLARLSDKIPIYAKDPSLEVRAFHSIVHPGSTSISLRQHIKAVSLNTNAGLILSPSITMYHLSCTRFDLLKRYYLYSGPIGVGKGHDPLTEISMFAYHSWVNTIKLASREAAIRKGVSLMLRSSANGIIFPPLVGITKLVPQNSIGKNYSQVSVCSPAQIAHEQVESVKQLVRTRSIEGLTLWPKIFSKPLVDTADYNVHRCLFLKPLIMAAVLSGRIFSGEGPQGSITCLSPSYSGLTIKRGIVYIRSKLVPHHDPIFYLLPDASQPCYQELFSHMFCHTCVPE